MLELGGISNEKNREGWVRRAKRIAEGRKSWLIESL
jgi:hypothetical protein